MNWWRLVLQAIKQPAVVNGGFGCDHVGLKMGKQNGYTSRPRNVRQLGQLIRNEEFVIVTDLFVP